MLNKLRKLRIKFTFDFFGGTGSDRPKNGNAKLTKLFLNNSIFLCPCANLYNSIQFNPTINDVVVAIAGIIRPAISLLLKIDKRSYKKGKLNHLNFTLYLLAVVIS